MLGDPVVDDLGPELLAQVERDVWQAHAVSESARGRDRLRRAAGLRAVAGGVGPELEGYGEDLLALLDGQERRYRAVDSAAHRYQRPVGLGPQALGLGC